MNQLLSVYGTAEIGVKNMGELNTEGWYEVCKNKFKSPGAFQHWVSELDGKLRTHDFHPLKTVPDGKSGNNKVWFHSPQIRFSFRILESANMATKSVVVKSNFPSHPYFG